MAGEGFSEMMKKNERKMKDSIPTFFGGFLFWTYYNTFLEDFFNLSNKGNLLFVIIFALVGGGIGMTLHRIYLKKNKKKREVFLWSVVIITFLIFVISFLLKIFLK